MSRGLLPAALALSLLAACASASGSEPVGKSAGNISGTVHGTKWTSFTDAYSIGKPSPGSPEVIVFLFEGPIECATLVNPNWDKTAIGEKQVLEIGVLKSMTGSFTVPMDASVAYLKGAYNPDADAGKVTLEAIHASKNIVGSFDVMFMNDSLKGSFDATYCADGVEP